MYDLAVEAGRSAGPVPLSLADALALLVDDAALFAALARQRAAEALDLDVLRLAVEVEVLGFLERADGAAAGEVDDFGGGDAAEDGHVGVVGVGVVLVDDERGARAVLPWSAWELDGGCRGDVFGAGYAGGAVRVGGCFG